MKKVFDLKKILLTFSAVCCCIAIARAQQFEWALNMGGRYADYGNAVAADAAGNTYVTGRYRDSVDFNSGPGNYTLKAVGGYDIFLTKYNTSGGFEWAISMGGSGYDEAFGVTVDDEGNVYITGMFNGTADFNPGVGTAQLVSAGNADIFLAKYDSSGNYVWARNMGGGDADQGNGVAVDNLGNVHVTGFYYSVPANFDAAGTGRGQLYSTGSGDVFIAKYDSAGNYIWAQSMGGSNGDEANDIKVDALGNVYITGNFMSTDADFDPSGNNIVTLISAGGWDIFFAKYDSSGNYVWAKGIGAAGDDYSKSLVVDTAGNLYITGVFVFSVDFDPGTGFASRVPVGRQDMFIARYSPDGNYVWAKNIGGTDDDEGEDIAMDKAGNIYISGRFNSPSVDFDPGSGTATVNTTPWIMPDIVFHDAYVAKYTANGDYIWVKSFGGSEADYGQSVAVDASGNIYVTGSFNSEADFDPGADTFTLTPVGGFDIFLLKLACVDTSSLYLRIDECSDNYIFNGETYTSSGTYKHYLTNLSGCDSIITLDLNFYELDPVIRVDEFVLNVSGSDYSTYQWLKNRAVIPGATDSTYTVTENAEYQVVVTNEAGCTDTSDVYIVNNVTIDDIEGVRQQINLYPNPAQDMVYIQSPINVDIVLTTIDGNTVLHQNNARTISVKELAQGIYFLRIYDKEGKWIKVEKIIKK